MSNYSNEYVQCKKGHLQKIDLFHSTHFNTSYQEKHRCFSLLCKVKMTAVKKGLSPNSAVHVSSGTF